MYPKNKLDSNYKLIKAVKTINGNTPSPTPTPSGDNVHVYPLEFDYNDREAYEGGEYSIYIDSTIKDTILQDYQTYGTSHCYFVHIKVINSNGNDFVKLIPIYFYPTQNKVNVQSVCYDGEYYISVYFDDDEVDLEVYGNESNEYTEVAIQYGSLYVYAAYDTYADSDAVSYLYNYIISNYGSYTKLSFSNYDTNDYCMLTCSNKNYDGYVFTGKVNNKPIALILTRNIGNNYDWKFIGKTLEVSTYNGGLIYDSPSNPVTCHDFYEELHLCCKYDITFELELIMHNVTINNKVTDLIFNKWDYINDGTNQRTHAVSTIIHPDGYVVSVDIHIENTSSQVMYNIITL